MGVVRSLTEFREGVGIASLAGISRYRVSVHLKLDMIWLQPPLKMNHQGLPLLVSHMCTHMSTHTHMHTHRQRQRDKNTKWSELAGFYPIKNLRESQSALTSPKTGKFWNSEKTRKSRKEGGTVLRIRKRWLCHPSNTAPGKSVAEDTSLFHFRNLGGGGADGGSSDKRRSGSMEWRKMAPNTTPTSALNLPLRTHMSVNTWTLPPGGLGI